MGNQRRWVELCTQAGLAKDPEQRARILQELADLLLDGEVHQAAGREEQTTASIVIGNPLRLFPKLLPCHVDEQIEAGHGSDVKMARLEEHSSKAIFKSVKESH